jgi:enolase
MRARGFSARWRPLARALAASAGIPLWQWITPDGVPPSLPVPHFNVLNGGVHAPNSLDFQEFTIAPVAAPSMAEAVRAGAEVYSAMPTPTSRCGVVPAVRSGTKVPGPKGLEKLNVPQEPGR